MPRLFLRPYSPSCLVELSASLGGGCGVALQDPITALSVHFGLRLRRQSRGRSSARTSFQTVSVGNSEKFIARMLRGWSIARRRGEQHHNQNQAREHVRQRVRPPRQIGVDQPRAEAQRSASLASFGKPVRGKVVRSVAWQQRSW
jgi:hypothetical protein